MKMIGNKCQLVGDDLFVTSVDRLKKGIKEECANSILIKPNQIGTLSETIDAINVAKKIILILSFLIALEKLKILL